MSKRRNAISRYIYDPTLYARPGDSRGDYSEEERREIRTLRDNYPELHEAWGDVAIAEAWADFSESVHMMRWIENLSRDEDFLLFLFLQQERGEIPWGTPAYSLKEQAAAYISGETVR
ncbi:hypothetical protein ACQPT2_21345 [Erwinia amylovora]